MTTTTMTKTNNNSNSFEREEATETLRGTIQQLTVGRLALEEAIHQRWTAVVQAHQSEFRELDERAQEVLGEREKTIEDLRGDKQEQAGDHSRTPGFFRGGSSSPE
jgi:exonuclease VII small subunit